MFSGFTNCTVVSTMKFLLMRMSCRRDIIISYFQILNPSLTPSPLTSPMLKYSSQSSSLVVLSLNSNTFAVYARALPALSSSTTAFALDGGEPYLALLSYRSTLRIILSQGTAEKEKAVSKFISSCYSLLSELCEFFSTSLRFPSSFILTSQRQPQFDFTHR